jgi:hypothetical protein
MSLYSKIIFNTIRANPLNLTKINVYIMYKLKLNQIREILNIEIKLEVAKLADGTAVEYEKLEPGFPVFVVDADGNKIPAPAGDHVLEDGVTTIEVDEQGVIVEVSMDENAEGAGEEPAVEAPVVEVAAAAEEPAEPTVEEPVVDEAMAAIHEKMQLAFAAIEEVAKDVAYVKEQCAAMQTKMEKFSKAPAATKAPVLNLNPASVDSFESRLEIIKNAMNTK